MKKRKAWKLTHKKFGDEYYLTDAKLNIAKKLKSIKNYKVERVIILSN
jgi:hypothetical protein